MPLRNKWIQKIKCLVLMGAISQHRLPFSLKQIYTKQTKKINKRGKGKSVSLLFSYQCPHTHSVGFNLIESWNRPQWQRRERGAVLALCVLSCDGLGGGILNYTKQQQQQHPFTILRAVRNFGSFYCHLACDGWLCGGESLVCCCCFCWVDSMNFDINLRFH